MCNIMKLAPALVKAQSELKDPAMDAKNPHFKSRFASLKSVKDAVVPVFNRNGLAIIQTAVPKDNGIGVKTLIIHVSGEILDAGEVAIPVAKQDAQAYMSAVTYARRYGMQLVAAVCGDPDDDGNGTKEVSAPDKQAITPNKPSASDIKWLQMMGECKKALGEPAYRKILEIHGVESSKEITDRNTRNAVYKHMQEQITANVEASFGAEKETK